jgi:hypothetical protein
MFRLLKALPLALAIVAIVALGLFAASCNSSGNALVRVVNAIPDAPANLDVDINGTKDFPNVQFDNVYPTQKPSGPAQYTSVVSGSDSIEAFDTGTTTVVVNSTTATLGASTQYTMLLGGFLNSSPSAYVITDNNTVPTTGNVNIRIINGSAISGSNGIDVYIYQTGLQPPANPSVTGLSLGASSGYLPFTFESSFSFDVYFHGNGFKQFTFTPNTGFVTGEIMTLVIVDQPNGGAISDIPLVLVDLD